MHALSDHINISFPLTQAQGDGAPAIRYPRALSAIEGERWLITPEALETVIAVAVHGEGENYRPGADMFDAFKVEGRKEVVVRDGIGVLHIAGPIFPHGNLLTRNSGATSLRSVQADFEGLMADNSVEHIVMHIDSPGGVANGIQAFAEMVFAARDTKRITAVAQDLAASAALWIGTAATEFVATPAAWVGSLGVVLTAYRDRQNAETIQIVSSQSPNKRQDPGSADGRNALQALVDNLAQVFVEAVARNRGASVETVLADFGRGSVMSAGEALRVGMVDRVATLEQILAGSVGVSSTTAGVKSMGDRKAETPVITREFIAENHPDIAQAFVAEGVASVDLTAARAEAAEAERNRIKAVQAQLLPGHEALIATLMFDGKTTGEQAAVQVLKAEREAGGTALAQLKAGAPAPAPAAIVEEPTPSAGNDSLPIEDRCKAEWDKDAKLRDEFGTLETYTAYMRANSEGRIKVLSKRAD